MRKTAALVASLLLAAPAAAQDDERVLRRQVVSGWTVTDVAESDGGRLVTLARRGSGYRISLRAIFWRGNGGELRGAEVRIGDCVTGDRETLVEPGSGSPAVTRQVLEDYLVGCRLPARQRASLLRGFDRPACLFERWAAEATADTAYENLQIAAYGTDEVPARPSPDYPDCRV